MIFGSAQALPQVSHSSAVITASAENGDLIREIDWFDIPYLNEFFAASSNGYVALSLLNGDKINIFNVVTGGCVNTVTKKDNEEIILGLRDDLTVITFDPEGDMDTGGKVLFYIKGSNNYIEWAVKDSSLYYQDGKLYYKYDGMLYTIDENGIHEESEINADTVSSPSVSIRKDMYVSSKQTDDDEMFPAYTIDLIGLSTGKLKKSIELRDYSCNTFNGQKAFTKDSLVFIPPKVDGLGRAPLIRCFDTETGALKYAIDRDHYGRYVFSEKSSYGFIRYDKPKKEEKDDKSELEIRQDKEKDDYIEENDGYLTFVDPSCGKRIRIPTGQTGMVLSDGCCLDENRWLVSVDYDNEEKKYVIDLSQAEDVEQLPMSTIHYEVEEELKPARAIADEMEKKYGITILMGSEINNLDDPYLTTFVGKDYYQGRLESASMVDRMKKLDSRLSHYPTGFFRAFKDPDGEGGYIFRFADFINGGVAGSGQIGKWYVETGNMDTTDGWAFEHESFHLFEALMNYRGGPLTEYEWNELDPEGFERFNVHDYSNITPPYNLDSMLNDPESEVTDPYFLTRYCMGNVCEDRAIMIGNLFFDDAGGETFDGEYHTKYFEQYTSYPHIKAKYDCMENWALKYYGYPYWKVALGIDPQPMKGDVDMNRVIDIEDAANILLDINGENPIKIGIQPYADVDGSYRVDILDAVSVIDHINGKKPIE